MIMIKLGQTTKPSVRVNKKVNLTKGGPCRSG